MRYAKLQALLGRLPFPTNCPSSVCIGGVSNASRCDVLCHEQPIGELETEAAVNQALNRLRERRGREGSPEAHSTGFIELKG